MHYEYRRGRHIRWNKKRISAKNPAEIIRFSYACVLEAQQWRNREEAHLPNPLGADDLNERKKNIGFHQEGKGKWKIVSAETNHF